MWTAHKTIIFNSLFRSGNEKNMFRLQGGYD
jgi:hypothetical protein